MITTLSPHPFDQTIDRLLAAIERRSLTLFARIDHAAGARQVGLELPDEQVVVFGNPRSGTPLMTSDPRVGIELPLRILIWSAEDGVGLGFRDPRELSGPYDIAGHAQILEQMANLLEQLVSEAAAA
jgi:uncharacterized protein (DUF302 family)